MIRRPSWQESLFGPALPAGAGAQALRERIGRLDDLLYGYWRLGEQVIALWTSSGRTLELLQFPHFALAEYVCGARPIAYRLDGTVGVDAGRLGQPVFGPMTLLTGQARTR